MNEIIQTKIQNQIYTIRSMQVMLDRDLAKLYQVETRVLNQAVKRNMERFSEEDFMFQLTEEEFGNLKSQIVISSSNWGGVRKFPFVFTEQGVYMLATVLKSSVAVDVTKQIMRTFTKMKNFLQNNSLMFDRFEKIEQKLLVHDEKIDKVFKALENRDLKPKQGVFYNGQIFDAYEFISGLIKDAKKEIILIDNYIDESVLTLFKKNQNIDITIYTKNVTKQLKLDVKKYNSQYKSIKVIEFKDSHDRFLIIDKSEVYHIGASLKDLGKKWFAFSKMDRDSLSILKRLR